jgi:peroxiredoxin Q/BCP
MRNAEIVGVSRDSVTSHANFADKQALPFPLIADTDESWCKAFDVIHEKVLYGKTHLGIVRSTFLIDPKGHLAQEWRGVKVAGHAQTVLDAIPAK